ncbi:hypothetical protein C0J52_17788 [Blattella germanica]|nr:hypothetical protein C0J52_17788 [Blattella germanica]
MGKAKRNRGKAKAENPTGIPSVRDIEREEEELTGNGDVHMSQQEYTIEALFEMLQSGKAEDKVIGLQTLATVFNAPETVECAVRHKVVKIAAPLLFDNSTAVRNAAAGALRACCGTLGARNLRAHFTFSPDPAKEREREEEEEIAPCNNASEIYADLLPNPQQSLMDAPWDPLRSALLNFNVLGVAKVPQLWD